RKTGELIGVLQSESKHIVTSGDYERFFIDKNGRCWHHILNPKTGYPMNSGIASVTVAASSAVMADALSTIIFLSGINEVQRYIEQFTDIQIIIVDEKLDIYISQGLKDYFNPTQNAEIYVIGGKKDNEKN
ncbi:MAG TPA: FAD:protein FMN transferase, partial [Petrotogaceae bacterium]|nr:FAD:protein FMN transferase [Petrotogaceae bacterium]